MTKNAKILTGIGCGLLVLGAIVLVGGYFTMNYLERRLAEGTKQYEAAGLEFGKTTDQQGCIDEGLRRGKTSSITDFSLAVSTFTESCLKNAKPVADFCAGVPGFWSLKDTEWGVEQCQKAHQDEVNTGCMHVFQAKHSFCSPPS